MGHVLGADAVVVVDTDSLGAARCSGRSRTTPTTSRRTSFGPAAWTWVRHLVLSPLGVVSCDLTP